MPAEFQEQIRHIYPEYAEEIPDPPEGVPAELFTAFAKSAEGAAVKISRFRSADGDWTVSLARDFLAVDTTKYQRWEEFNEHLMPAVRALESCYSPARYARVGLRYRNVIVRSLIGAKDQPWRGLLQPQIAAELATDKEPLVQGSKHVIAIRLGEGPGIVRMTHGLGNHPSGELAYLIDNDFHVDETTEVSDVSRVLDEFNRDARGLFRWCITDALHERLGPDPAG